MFHSLILPFNLLSPKNFHLILSVSKELFIPAISISIFHQRNNSTAPVYAPPTRASGRSASARPTARSRIPASSRMAYLRSLNRPARDLETVIFQFFSIDLIYHGGLFCKLSLYNCPNIVAVAHWRNSHMSKGCWNILSYLQISFITLINIFLQKLSAEVLSMSLSSWRKTNQMIKTA